MTNHRTCEETYPLRLPSSTPSGLWRENKLLFAKYITCGKPRI